jgi:hypothetical protein
LGDLGSRIAAREPIPSILVCAKTDRNCHDRTSEIGGFAQRDNAQDHTKGCRKGCTKDNPARASAKALVAARNKKERRTRLKQGVFKLTDPKKIAASLKRSAECSSRRKAGAYRSALSMLTFYINRAGKTLPKTQRERLERAKTDLRRQFGRD